MWKTPAVGAPYPPPPKFAPFSCSLTIMALCRHPTAALWLLLALHNIQNPSWPMCCIGRANLLHTTSGPSPTAIGRANLLHATSARSLHSRAGSITFCDPRGYGSVPIFLLACTAQVGSLNDLVYNERRRMLAQ